eukprot:5104249-Ditylum_brightwellii.AAC.1
MACTPRKKAPSPKQQTQQASTMLTPPPNMQVNITSTTTNERGDLLTWNSNSNDGILFKDLYLAGQFLDFTTSHIKAKYNSHFGKHANKTLISAHQNLHRKDQRESNAKQAQGSH